MADSAHEFSESNTEARASKDFSSTSSGNLQQNFVSDFPTKDEFTDIVSGISEATLDWHKELLFGLLLQFDDSELFSLAHQTGIELSDSKRTQEPQSFVNNSKLSILPQILHDFTDPRLSSKKDICNNGTYHQNTKHASLSEVESGLTKEFMNSGLPWDGYPSSTGGIDKPEVIVQSKPTQGSLRCTFPVKDTDKATSKDKPKSQSQNYEPFSLLFNECSLFAISCWASSGQVKNRLFHGNTKKIDDQKHISLPFSVPVPAPQLRKCNLCGKWGHYDSECDQMEHTDMIKVANEIELQHRLYSIFDKKAPPKKKYVQGHLKSSLVVLNQRQKRTKTQSPSESKVTNNSMTEKLETKDNTQTDLAIISPHSMEEDRICEICDFVCTEGEVKHICNGCGRVFHDRCLRIDPSIKTTWICNFCSGYDSDVSSTVDIEGCEGFVIEQHKYSEKDERKFFKMYESQYGDWTSALTICNSDSVGNLSASSRCIEMAKRQIEYMSTVKVTPLIQSESICSCAISMSGYKKVKTSLLRDSSGGTDTSDSSNILGLWSRPDDGVVPVFCSPSVKCSLCEAYFPSHLLNSIFHPPAYISDGCKDITPPFNSKYPPLPWGLLDRIAYVCCHCDRKKPDVEGSVVIKKKPMTWIERCQIVLVNLKMLANPTQMSKMTSPPILSKNWNKKPNAFYKYHIFFTVKEITDFITERDVFLALESKNNDDTTKNLRKHAHDTLRDMVKEGMVEWARGDEDVDFYSLTQKGFPHKVGAHGGFPQHIFSMMELSPTKTGVRASYIAKSHPGCIISWPAARKRKKPDCEETDKANSIQLHGGIAHFAKGGSEDYDDIDVTEEDGIVILSKHDGKINQTNFDQTSSEALPKSGKSIRLPVNDKNKGERDTNQASSDIWKQGIKHEKESTNLKSRDDLPTFLEMPSSSQDLVGAIVAWETTKLVVESHHQCNEIDITEKSPPQIEVGSVISISYNGLALIRIISNLHSIASSLANGDTNSGHKERNGKPILLSTTHLGATIWIPVKKLKLIAKAPSQSTVKSSVKTLRSALFKDDEHLNHTRSNNATNTSGETSSTDIKKINTSSALVSRVSTDGGKTKRRKYASKDASKSLFPSQDEYEQEQKYHSSQTTSRKSGRGGIFQAEKIMGDRVCKVTMAKTYLIKWKGFGPDESTWEPEKNILNRNLLLSYRIGTFLSQLQDTPEVRDRNSVTSKVITALEQWNLEVTGVVDSKSSSSSECWCPFCDGWYKEGSGFASHIRRHHTETNYAVIREVAKFMADER